VTSPFTKDTVYMETLSEKKSKLKRVETIERKYTKKRRLDNTRDGERGQFRGV